MCEIWFKFKEHFCKGFLDDLENKVLQGISHAFKSENMTCLDVGLPETDNLRKRNKKEMTFYENISKKIVADLNVDQKMILDYITTRWCNPLEEGSTEKGVRGYDSGYYNFRGREALLVYIYSQIN